MPLRVAVVGGGMSGLMLLARLRGMQRTRQALADGSLQVVIFEQHARGLGPGLAWDPGCNPAWLANDSTRELGGPSRLWEDDVDEYLSRELRLPLFPEWAANNGHSGVALYDFPPRRLVGMYFHELGSRLLAAGGGVSLVEACVDAIECLEVNARFLVRAGGMEHICDSVVLCSGAPQVQNVRQVPGTKAPREIGAVPSEASVAVLGTGLSGVDGARALWSQGHTGRILMTSRQGRFPCIHRDYSRPQVLEEVVIPPKVCTHQRISELPERTELEVFASLLRDEVRAQGVDGVDEAWFLKVVGARDGIEELRQQVQDYDRGGRMPWMGIAWGLKSAAMATAWRKLSDQAKRRWMAGHWPRIWQNYTNPMPVEVGRSLVRAVDDGALGVRGRLSGVRATPGGGFVIGFEDGQEEHVDQVIDASGFGFEVDADSCPMLKDLLQAECCQISPWGGIQVDPATLQAIPAGKSRGGSIFASGHMVRGTCYMTSGISFCRSHAKLVADALAAKLAPISRSRL